MEKAKLKHRNLFYPPIITLALTACNSGGDLHDHPNLKTGKQLFEFHCASCHSKDGHGQFLKAIPSNRDTKLSIQQIVTHIRKNKTGEKRTMPLFAKMGSDEARKIALYLMDLKKQHLKK